MNINRVILFQTQGIFLKKVQKQQGRPTPFSYAPVIMVLFKCFASELRNAATWIKAVLSFIFLFYFIFSYFVNDNRYQLYH